MHYFAVESLARTNSKGGQLLVRVPVKASVMNQYANNQQRVSSAPLVTVQVLHSSSSSSSSSGSQASVIPMAATPLGVPITNNHDSVRGSVAVDKVRLFR